jgi:hypothetical protein
VKRNALTNENVKWSLGRQNTILPRLLHCEVLHLIFGKSTHIAEMNVIMEIIGYFTFNWKEIFSSIKQSSTFYVLLT